MQEVTQKNTRGAKKKKGIVLRKMQINNKMRRKEIKTATKLNLNQTQKPILQSSDLILMRLLPLKKIRRNRKGRKEIV